MQYWEGVISVAIGLVEFKDLIRVRVRHEMGARHLTNESPLYYQSKHAVSPQQNNKESL